MKHLLDRWRYFLLCEEKIGSKEELFKYLPTDPEHILIDKPMGLTKKFGGIEDSSPLPFHYGEWKHLINPSDGMGWDLIIVPSLSKFVDNVPDVPAGLIPVGHVQYNSDQDLWDRILKNSDKQKPENIEDNTKIIVADKEWDEQSEKDKLIINNFFANIPQFKKVEWY